MSFTHLTPHWSVWGIGFQCSLITQYVHPPFGLQGTGESAFRGAKANWKGATLVRGSLWGHINLTSDQVENPPWTAWRWCGSAFSKIRCCRFCCCGWWRGWWPLPLLPASTNVMYVVWHTTNGLGWPEVLWCVNKMWKSGHLHFISACCNYNTTAEAIAWVQGTQISKAHLKVVHGRNPDLFGSNDTTTRSTWVKKDRRWGEVRLGHTPHCTSSLSSDKNFNQG